MPAAAPQMPTLNPLWPEAGPPDRCVTCVWHHLGGPGKAVDRCHRHAGARVDPRWPACPAHTAAVDCLTCGACCREAYHSVEVAPRDPFVRAHPDRVVRQDGRLTVARDNGRCACLSSGSGGYACVVYADRPRTCRDFPKGGRSCVEARRRVGLSR